MMVLVYPFLYLVFFAWALVLLALALAKRKWNSVSVFAPLTLFGMIGLLNSAAAKEVFLALEGVFGG